MTKERKSEKFSQQKVRRLQQTDNTHAQPLDVDERLQRNRSLFVTNGSNVLRTKYSSVKSVPNHLVYALC